MAVHIGKVVSLNLSNQLNEKFTFSYNIGCVSETSNTNTSFGYLFNDNFCIDLSIAKKINHNMFYTSGILAYNFKLKH